MAPPPLTSVLPDDPRTREALAGIASWLGEYGTHVCYDPVDSAKRLKPHLEALLSPGGEADDTLDRKLLAEPALAPVFRRWFVSPAYGLAELAAHREGTLARAYHDFLVRYGLSHDYYGKLPTETPSQLFKARAIGYHDYFHLVSGYGADPLGEIGAVSFTMANRLAHLGDVGAAVSLQVTLTLAGAMARYAVHYPHALASYQRMYAEGVARGMASKPIDVVDWEDLWDRPVEDVRAELGIPPRPDGADDAYSPMAAAAE